MFVDDCYHDNTPMNIERCSEIISIYMFCLVANTLRKVYSLPIALVALLLVHVIQMYVIYMAPMTCVSENQQQRMCLIND